MSGDLLPRSPRLFSVLLNVAGIVVVAFFLVRQGLLSDAPWVVAVTAIAMVAWLTRAVTLGAGSAPPRAVTRASREETVGTAAAAVAVVLGSVVAVPTDVLGYLPALVCVGALLSSPHRSPRLGVSLALISVLVVAVVALVRAPVPPNVLLGAGAGLLVAVLVGISRRQVRVAASRERELLDERLRLSDEREHAAALAERSRIARDIHDVLAHSLGGLVLQLDAVDALLESGRVEQARTRVTSARALAASGLDEARRAVDALRDPDDAADLPAALADLVATHRSLGAEASLTVDGEPGPLPAPAAGALRRAAQEALTNARRHAPGAPTSLHLSWSPDAAALTSSTPLPSHAAAAAAEATSGGGRGLTGVRERVTALGGRADWGVHDGVFDLTTVVPR